VADNSDALLLIMTNGPTIVRGIRAVFILGFLGGFVGELISLHGLRTAAPSELPKYIKSKFYWLMAFIMACAGGGLAALYGTDEVQALLAVNIGASAPLILRSFASSIPTIKPKID
jgi:hypothetical protein